MTDGFRIPEEQIKGSTLANGIKVATTISDAVETGLEPGMPRNIVANAAAVGIAFLLGDMFARPR
jgi:hypothetical protein